MKTYEICRRQLALGLGFLFLALLLSMNQVQKQRDGSLTLLFNIPLQKSFI